MNFKMKFPYLETNKTKQLQSKTTTATTKTKPCPADHEFTTSLLKGTERFLNLNYGAAFTGVDYGVVYFSVSVYFLSFRGIW